MIESWLRLYLYFITKIVMPQSIQSRQESLAICQYLLCAVVLIRFSHYGPHQSELGMDVLSKQLAFVRWVGLDFCSIILSF